MIDRGSGRAFSECITYCCLIYQYIAYVKYPFHFNANATAQLNDYDLNRICWQIYFHSRSIWKKKYCTFFSYKYMINFYMCRGWRSSFIFVPLDLNRSSAPDLNRRQKILRNCVFHNRNKKGKGNKINGLSEVSHFIWNRFRLNNISHFIKFRLFYCVSNRDLWKMWYRKYAQMFRLDGWINCPCGPWLRIFVCISIILSIEWWAVWILHFIGSANKRYTTRGSRPTWFGCLNGKLQFPSFIVAARRKFRAQLWNIIAVWNLKML